LIAGTPKSQALLPIPRRNSALAPVSVVNNIRMDTPLVEPAGMLETITFYMGLALIFTKFAMLQEIQTEVMHFNLYLLYIFGIPAIFGMVMAGGLARTLTSRTTYYWVGFTLWMLICVPFSSWRSASFSLALSFLRTNLVMLFVVAGLVVSWRQCHLVLQSVGVAALCNLASSRIFANPANEGRLNLDFGTVGNSTDFAAHLLLTLPFLLLFVYSAKSLLPRIGALLGVGFGIFTILRTGSRGALVALVVGALFMFLRGRSRERIALVGLVPICLAVGLVFLPSQLVDRLRSFSASSSNVDLGAIESSQSRAYLLRKAVEYTAEFPLFGVGPGQFPSYEGGHSKTMGTHGYWHETHNVWLQASSECGVPGGLLFLAGWVSAFLLVNRTHRKAKSRSDCEDLQATTLCVMLAIICFCTAITFLNFAYLFYGPAIAGLAIALDHAADSEIERRSRIATTAA